MEHHTPGTWSIVEERDTVAIVSNEQPGALAFIPPAHPYARMNARLIAASPDLLAACRDAIAHMSGREKSCGHPWECVCTGQALLAAVEKATKGSR